MYDLSLHVLDLVENALRARAKLVEIQVVEDRVGDLLTLEIKDDGQGMTEEMVEKAEDPFFTTRTTRKVGLGLSLFAQAARLCNGGIKIESQQDRGTTVKGRFQLSHVDLKPWGSMVNTLLTLIVGNPEVDFLYHHRKDSFEYTLDTRSFKKKLKELSLSHPKAITLLKNELKKNLHKIGID